MTRAASYARRPVDPVQFRDRQLQSGWEKEKTNRRVCLACGWKRSAVPVVFEHGMRMRHLIFIAVKTAGPSFLRSGSFVFSQVKIGFLILGFRQMHPAGRCCLAYLLAAFRSSGKDAPFRFLIPSPVFGSTSEYGAFLHVQLGHVPNRAYRNGRHLQK